MEGGPRRSDIIDAAQECTTTIRVTLQEAPTIGTRLINVQEGRKPKNI